MSPPPAAAAPKAPVIEFPQREVGAPQPVEPEVSATPTSEAPSQKPIPLAAIGIGVVVIALLGAVWYFHYAGTTPRQPPGQATNIAKVPIPSNSAAASGQTETPAPGANAESAPTPQDAAANRGSLDIPAGGNRKAHKHKPAPPAAPPPPETNPQAAEIVRLENLARDAYAKGNYAEPPDANSVAYLKRVLVISPNDNYAKSLLENSVGGGKYQAQQAILRKDFASAHRTANNLAQLLPGRSDVTELQQDISIAEKANQQARPAEHLATVSFRAYHMHSEKAPADHGPYCLGTLSVVAQHVKFTGASASEGQQVHNLDLACSDVRDIKRNAHVASHQAGFHVRTTSTNINFAPEDSSPAHIAPLASACR